VVLGKGHETGQEIGGVVHAFDDREALRAALDGLVYRPEAPA
jgi:UDP-N-acetylmuramoyl-L-alanyl-D-glutamate--2,6-diaminopimelate ligase